MNSFPQETLRDLKAHLEEELARVATRIDELTGQDPFHDPDRASDNAASDTEASEESNHDRVAAILEELNTKKQGLDAALARIEAGTYGFCTTCGEMIDTDRLAIYPTATVCLSCSSKKAS